MIRKIKLGGPEDEVDLIMATAMVGLNVHKKSKRPFKSGQKNATVNGIIRHPITERWAVTFEEDDSHVEVKQLTVGYI